MRREENADKWKAGVGRRSGQRGREPLLRHLDVGRHDVRGDGAGSDAEAVASLQHTAALSHAHRARVVVVPTDVGLPR